MDQVAKSVAERFRGNSRVLIHRMTSVSFLEHAAATRLVLDWVYIDGDHETPAVCADLAGAWTIVRPGGVVAGDDYFLKRPELTRTGESRRGGVRGEGRHRPGDHRHPVPVCETSLGSGNEADNPAGVTRVRGRRVWRADEQAIRGRQDRKAG